jgi:hypothetical protein
MAKIIDLPRFNSDRIEYTSPRQYTDGSGVITNLNSSSGIIGHITANFSNTLQFENKNGDNIVITPLELKEHISEFITNEINLYADESVKLYKEGLERRLDVQMSKIEEHLNDKIIKMTQEIISTTTSRLIQEEVNRRVDEKLRKIKKAIDDSI